MRPQAPSTQAGGRPGVPPSGCRGQDARWPTRRTSWAWQRSRRQLHMAATGVMAVLSPVGLARGPHSRQQVSGRGGERASGRAGSTSAAAFRWITAATRRYRRCSCRVRPSPEPTGPYTCAIWSAAGPSGRQQAGDDRPVPHRQRRARLRPRSGRPPDLPLPAPPRSATTAKSPKAQADSEHAGARGRPPRNVPYEIATSAH